MKSENQMQDEKGNWVDAVEEPYHPTWLERNKFYVLMAIVSIPFVIICFNLLKLAEDKV